MLCKVQLNLIFFQKGVQTGPFLSLFRHCGSPPCSKLCTRRGSVDRQILSSCWCQTAPPPEENDSVADPWAKHQPEGAAPQEPVGYIFRTPQAGGHWIAILPPSAMGAKSTEGNAMVLCDSLRKFPYALKAAEMEMLMTSCVAVGAAGKTSWAAFLATKDQQAVSDGAKDSEATAIASERDEGTVA